MNEKSSGFTVVETVVTLMIVVLFIVAINTLFVAIIRGTASNRNRSEASNLAYSYLRKYAYNNAPTSWFTCDTTDDLQANPSAKGQSLESGSLSNAQSALPQPVSYAVSAFAPYGCTADSVKAPVLVRSTITYGPDSLTVDHATYLERS